MFLFFFHGRLNLLQRSVSLKKDKELATLKSDLLLVLSSNLKGVVRDLVVLTNKVKITVLC